MKAAVLGLALAAAVLLGVVAMRGGVADHGPAPDQANAKGEASVTVTRRHAPEVVLVIKPGAPSPLKAAPVSARISPLMEQYNSKRDRKAIYDRLSQLPSPTAEERYVLAEILNDCRMAAEMKGVSIDKIRDEHRDRLIRGLSPKDPMRDKRLAAIDAQFGRRGGTPACQGFENMAITRAGIRTAMNRAAEAGDPRARARAVELEMWAPMHAQDGQAVIIHMHSNLPKVSDEQLATLREALRSGDPTVIAVAGRILSSSLADVQIRFGPDESAVDLRAFHDAWSLAGCDAGSECGANHDMIVSGCSAFGNCEAANVRDYLFFYSNSPQQSQRVAQYHEQITRAIRTGDWSAFQFHRGPPPSGLITGYPPP